MEQEVIENSIIIKMGEQPTAVFGRDGTVKMWDEEKQELRKIDIDKELAQCFVYVITKTAGLDPSKIIEAIKNGTLE